MELPQIISVDDHVVEPPDLWQRTLPARFRDAAPRVERIKGRFGAGARGDWTPADDGEWADIWSYAFPSGVPFHKPAPPDWSRASLRVCMPSPLLLLLLSIQLLVLRRTCFVL